MFLIPPQIVLPPDKSILATCCNRTHWRSLSGLCLLICGQSVTNISPIPKLKSQEKRTMMNENVNVSPTNNITPDQKRETFQKYRSIMKMTVMMKMFVGVWYGTWSWSLNILNGKIYDLVQMSSDENAFRCLSGHGHIFPKENGKMHLTHWSFPVCYPDNHLLSCP